MQTPNHKTIGSILIGISILLLLMLTFLKLNVDEEEAFLCNAVEESPKLTMEECPAHDSNSSWYILAGFLFVFLILASGLYMIFLPVQREQDSRPHPKISPGTLTAEEKVIYDLIMGQQGSRYQSDLIQQTGHSKVKMSRILDRMEGKGVIERKRRGMTNMVILK